MSITITTDVFCDGDCGVWTTGFTGVKANSKEARKNLVVGFGWVCNKKGDFCPECARALKRDRVSDAIAARKLTGKEKVK